MANPVGGTGQDVFIMIEMHYDNPESVEGNRHILAGQGLTVWMEEPRTSSTILSCSHLVAATL